MPPYEDVPYDIPVADTQQSGPIKIENKYVEACERELLSFVLEDGCSELEFEQESKYYTGELVTVADFIDSTLADSELVFLSSSYDKTYEAYFELYQEGLTQQVIQQRLLNSVDQEIAAVAKSLLIDKYEITVKNYEQSMTARSTVLVMFVPKSLLAYQAKRIELLIKEKTTQMASMQDPESLEKLLMEIDGLNKVRTMLNNELGRV